MNRRTLINTGNVTLIDPQGNAVTVCPEDPCDFDPTDLCEELESCCDCSDADLDPEGVYFCFIIEKE